MCMVQVREMVYDFYESRYAGCLARLQQRLPIFRLDPHLSPHVDALHKMVSLVNIAIEEVVNFMKVARLCTLWRQLLVDGILHKGF